MVSWNGGLPASTRLCQIRHAAKVATQACLGEEEGKMGKAIRAETRCQVTSTRFFLNPDQGFADVCNAYTVPEERRFSFDRRGK